MLEPSSSVDVLVLGAGPAGSIASTILARRDRQVLCIERSFFPRYSIGESLLPRSTQLLEEAGLLDVVKAQRFQVKYGSTFFRGREQERFRFADGFPDQPPSAFQVPRAEFDQTLATAARTAGADVRFGLEVQDISFDDEGTATAKLRDVETGEGRQVQARFVIDASGAGRVLPRLLKLETPATLGPRGALFTMVEGDIRPEGEAAGDVWVCIEPKTKSWIWFIPFSNGRTSVGVVTDVSTIDAAGPNDQARLAALLASEPATAKRLARAISVMQTKRLAAWSAAVTRLSGPGYAIAGNAGEFLDPVFSSGVTIALESGVLAAKLCDRQLSGEGVDWTGEYDVPLRRAVAVFKAFVEGWYRDEVPEIFFARHKVASVKRYITSILAGHVLDTSNPLVRDPEGNLRRLLRAVSAQGDAKPIELL